MSSNLEKEEKNKEKYHGATVYQFDSVPSTAPSRGGSSSVLIGSGGRITNMKIYFEISVSSADVVLQPSAFWLSETDGIVIMIDGVVIWRCTNLPAYISSISFNEKFDEKSRFYNINPDTYKNAFQVPSGTTNRRFWLEVPNPFQSIQPHINALNKSRFTVKITYNSDWTASSSSTASNCTLKAAGIVLEEDKLSIEEEQQELTLWQSPVVKKKYTYIDVQNFIQDFSAATTYDLLLSAFEGDYSAFFICCRGASTTSLNAFRFYQLGSAENGGSLSLLNPSKTAYRNITPLTSDWNILQAFDFFPNAKLFERKKGIYPIVCVDEVMQAIEDGVYDSYLRILPNSFLRIVGGSNDISETPAVFTLNVQENATSLSFSILLIVEGRTYSTGPIQYNDSVATVQGLFDKLNCYYDEIITVGGSPLGAGDMTITLSNLSRDRDYSQNFQFAIGSNSLQGASGDDLINLEATTAPVAANGSLFTGSSLNLTVIGFKQYESIFKNGRFVAAHPT